MAKAETSNQAAVVGCLLFAVRMGDRYPQPVGIDISHPFYAYYPDFAVHLTRRSAANQEVYNEESK